MTRAQFEYMGILVLVLVFGSFLVFAIDQSRIESRDDMRRVAVHHMKQALELYFNEYEYYVTPPTSTPDCTQSDDPSSWFFSESSPVIQEGIVDDILGGTKRGHKYVYSYCVTKIEGDNTSGYYIEAQLERPHPEAIAFDEDEGRKYYHRIVTMKDTTLYRVCGGTEDQCTPPNDEMD